MSGPIPRLENDGELIRAMGEDMKFLPDASLDDTGKQIDAIRYFMSAYGDTDQDTVMYAPELVVVIRNILDCRRPTRLRYLTDFDGEEANDCEGAEVNEAAAALGIEIGSRVSGGDTEADRDEGWVYGMQLDASGALECLVAWSCGERTWHDAADLRVLEER